MPYEFYDKIHIINKEWFLMNELGPNLYYERLLLIG